MTEETISRALVSSPSGPDEIHALVMAKYENDLASQHLDITIQEVSSGLVTMSMPVSEHMLNGHGILHGGYLFLLGDTCFAFVCESLGKSSVSRQAEITYIAPGSVDQVLFATGAERTSFGRNNIVDVSIRNHLGDLLAEVRVFGVLTRL